MAAQTDQLSGLDDRAALGASVSETAESYAIFGSYYIPLVHPEVLTLGTTIGYSSYDASTFGVRRWILMVIVYLSMRACYGALLF